MILLKSEARKSKAVAAILGSCEPSVNAWLWRYINDGINALHNKSGQGRIPILQPSQDVQSVRSSIAQHRQRISQARAELEDSLGKKFSEKTLRRFLKNLPADINASENLLQKRKSRKFMTGK
jgi:transposase